eukprot:308171-Rhodomonas_salina.2
MQVVDWLAKCKTSALFSACLSMHAGQVSLWKEKVTSPKAGQLAIGLRACYAVSGTDLCYVGAAASACSRTMQHSVLTLGILGLMYQLTHVAGARLRPCSAYLGMGLRACYSMPMSGQGTESTNLEDHATNLRNSNAKKNGVLAQPVLTSWVLAIGSRDWLWESRSGQSGSKDVSRRGSVTAWPFLFDFARDADLTHTARSASDNVRRSSLVSASSSLVSVSEAAKKLPPMMMTSLAEANALNATPQANDTTLPVFARRGSAASTGTALAR